jgi:prepilin peptidase CpaA
MLNSVLILAPFVLLLVVAAGWDLASYTIPNFIPAMLLVAFVPFAAMSGYSFGEYQSHFLAATIALVAGFTLFALGYIGGGDAKFFAAASAWFGLHDLLPYVVIASLFGGGLTLSLLAMRRMPLPAALAGQNWIVRLHEPRGGIPYGVALSAGALAVLPYTELFHKLAS